MSLVQRPQCGRPRQDYGTRVEQRDRDFAARAVLCLHHGAAVWSAPTDPVAVAVHEVCDFDGGVYVGVVHAHHVWTGSQHLVEETVAIQGSDAHAVAPRVYEDDLVVPVVDEGVSCPGCDARVQTSRPQQLSDATDDGQPLRRHLAPGHLHLAIRKQLGVELISVGTVSHHHSDLLVEMLWLWLTVAS